MDHFISKNRILHCEEVPLPAIAQAVGTPVYIYSTATMERHARLFQAAVRDNDPLVAFAVKANPNPAVLAKLARQGLGADIVSGGEYQLARIAGIEAHKILFSGVGKTAEEMELALSGGLQMFNLESIAEAEMLSSVALRLGRQAPVALRINPDIDAGSHSKISTGRADDKFGIPSRDCLQAFDHLRALGGLKIKGIAVHIGSQITILAPFEQAFRQVGELLAGVREAGHEISLVDLGGGLGIPYESDKPHPPSLEAYGAMVRKVTAGWNVRLAFEPGRLIMGNAGVLLTQVIRVKPGRTHPFVILDSGMNDLLRPSLYDAVHRIESVQPNGRTMVADLVGPVCESGDVFARGRTVDQLAEGDLAVIRSCGAYAAAMASTYNSRPLIPEVLVAGARFAVVRERPRFDEEEARRLIPDWLVDDRNSQSERVSAPRLSSSASERR